MLRYRNTATAETIAMLMTGLAEAESLLEADIATLGSMVIVDPDFSQTWKTRMSDRQRVRDSLRARIHIVKKATEEAMKDLEQKDVGRS